MPIRIRSLVLVSLTPWAGACASLHVPADFRKVATGAPWRERIGG